MYVLDKEMYKLLCKTNFNLGVLILIPILFYFGVELLVHYNTHTICIFKFITGHECPGCGMTRAFSELFQFHFKEALEFNPRVVIVAPLLVYIWISTLVREIKCKINNS